MKRILLIFMILIILLSIASVYYRYVMLEDFAYETKPLDEFTEEDF